jgi:hypothetical protein
MARRRTTLSSILLVAAVALAISSPAVAAVTITQDDSPDPVNSGQNVTYSMTVSSSTGDELWLGTLTTKPDSDAAVANPYFSISASQGSCSVDPPDSYGYTGGSCYLGNVPAGGSVSIQGVVQANWSMRHLVTLFYCDPYASPTCGPFFTSGEITGVIHPPSLSGSQKFKVSGFPPGCVTDAFTARAKAKGEGVRSVSATLSGPKNEYGGPAEGASGTERIAKKPGRKVKAEIADLEAGFWELTFLALRKGAPNFKRTLTFQVC